MQKLLRRVFIVELLKEEVAGSGKVKRPHRIMLTRLLALAAHALAEVHSLVSYKCKLCICNKLKCGIMCNATYLGRNQAGT